ncbi:MAG: glutamine synthetase family protein [Alicyclobacillus sp.]|nr:glutamine synthetase family protein [Alicyclobacillus sp.]
MNSMTAEDVRRVIQNEGIEVVRVVFNDVANVARARNIPADTFVQDVLEGGVQYPSAMFSVDTGGNFVLNAGAGFAGGYGSWLLKVDPATFTVLPWAPKTARIIADVYTLDGEPVPVYPRGVLRHVLAELERDGYSTLGAAELEFYVFRELNPSGYTATWTGLQCYSEVKQAEVDELLWDMVVPMKAIGIQVEAANTEYGPGQFEVSMKPFRGLAQADAAFYYKTSIKELMRKRGLLATFMAKPLTGLSGSGAHFHHSLYDIASGKNAFYDPADERGMSETFKHFIAGQLAHSAAICAFANPSVNSYRRMRPYTFAPFNVTWGFENRMCLIRVPHSRGQGTHLENRMPGADHNPYLMMAAMYAAGLDGIRKRTPLPEPVVGEDAYAVAGAPQLPVRLEDALSALQQDEVLRGYLGGGVIDAFVALKMNEITRFHNQVTAWEIQEYAELF